MKEMDYIKLKVKYKRRPDSLGRMRYPAGGQDIQDLLDVIRNLLYIVQFAECRLDITSQNEINAMLWPYRGNMDEKKM